MSAYSLMRDPRTLKLSDAKVVLSPASRSSVQVPFTVVVLVRTVDSVFFKTLLSLANVLYELEVIFVCTEPSAYTPLAAQLAAYRHLLPKVSVFRPTGRLSLLDSVTAGLQDARGQFVCILTSGDFVHMHAFERLSKAVDQQTADCCRAPQFYVNSHGWAVNLGGSKTVWRLDYILAQYGRLSTQLKTLKELEQALSADTAAGRQVEIDDVLFFKSRESDK